MAEYWIVSAPGKPTPEDAFSELTTQIGSHASCQRFNIPDLKVGTLDSLVAMSDQLAKLDPFVESVVRKIVKYIHDIVDPDDRPNLYDNLLVGQSKLTTDLYVSRFQWDMARYPNKQPIPNIVDMIAKIINDIDGEYKRKTTSYNNIRSQSLALERKAAGNLMTKSLNDIVDEKDVVVGSEYMQTLVVVVPKSLYKEWDKSYERLTEMVVPRCSKKIAEDSEYGLFSVTLFRKVADEFKQNARDKKFIVREFEYNPKAIKAERDERQKLEVDLKRMYAPLMNWLKVNFAVAFTAWIHIKALRTFIESVLRYGLPVNFQAAIVKPYKSPKHVQKLLNQLYEELDTNFDVGKDDDHIDLTGIVTQDYHPYVFFKLPLDLLPH